MNMDFKAMHLRLVRGDAPDVPATDFPVAPPSRASVPVSGVRIRPPVPGPRTPDACQVYIALDEIARQAWSVGLVEDAPAAASTPVTPWPRCCWCGLMLRPGDPMAAF